MLLGKLEDIVSLVRGLDGRLEETIRKVVIREVGDKHQECGWLVGRSPQVAGWWKAMRKSPGRGLFGWRKPSVRYLVVLLEETVIWLVGWKIGGNCQDEG